MEGLVPPSFCFSYTESAEKVSDLHNVKGVTGVSPFCERPLGPGGTTREIKRDLLICLG